MENGGGNLESKFSGLALRDSPNGDGLFQVMKAVEAAEATIKQQVFYFYFWKFLFKPILSYSCL